MNTPNRVKAISLAVLLGLSGSVWAGLGSVKVYSRLGEPFYATIPLTGQTARDATDPTLSSDSDMNKLSIQGSASASKLNFRIVRKNKQNVYVEVRSSTPISEPILTFGVSVSSASGTVSKQFSAMVDPREYNVPRTPKSPEKIYKPASGKASNRLRYSGRTVHVQEGDTLSEIAGRFKPARMSLANTRRAIFLANKNAFINGNPSQLKKGATLKIPTEARMRALLASGRKTSTIRRTTPKPVGSPSVTGSNATTVAPNTDNSKQLAELQAELKRSQEKIKKLEAEVKNANKPVKEPEPVKDSEPKPIEPKGDDSKPDEVKPVEPVIASAVNDPVSDISDVIILDGDTSDVIDDVSGVVDDVSEPPVAPPPEEPPVKRPPPIPEDIPPEPTIVDMLMENIVPIGGGIAAVALLGGGLVVMRMRKRKQNKSQAGSFDDDGYEDEETFFKMNVEDEEPKREVKFSQQSQPDNKKVALPEKTAKTVATRMTETEAQENKPPSTFMSDFTRMSAAIDSVEIDPLSEAEVYIAYGRTDEAEEILKDALAKDPAQHEVRKKLLEIYAGRQEVGPFTTIAKELYDAFDGRGALWQEVAEMGRQLDPNNSLYSANVATDRSVQAEPEISQAVEELEEDNDFTMDFTTSDFSNDNNVETPVVPAPSEDMKVTSTNEVDSEDDGFLMDFSSATLDMTPTLETKEIVTENDFSAGNALEFDLDAVLDDAKGSGHLEEEVSEVESLGFDGLEGLSFDLDDSTTQESGVSTDLSVAEEDDPAFAKLELAKVYVDMGDIDGAREALTDLLEESLSPNLRTEVEDMLRKITL